MALDFPYPPTLGQTFAGPGGVIWTWDNVKWVATGSGGGGGGGGAGVTVSPTPPASPTVGQLWWDSTGGQLYIRYEDPNTQQWVTTHNIGFGVPLNVANGGTGIVTYSQGDLIYGSAPDTLARLTKSTAATRYLANTGASNNPAWDQVNLTNGVTGILPIANGGTGAATAGATPWVQKAGDTMTGALAIAPPSGQAIMLLNKSASGLGTIIYGQTAGSTRWTLLPGDLSTETGSNAGSNFAIQRYNDAGAIIDTPLMIRRSDGNVFIGGIQINPAGAAMVMTSPTTGFVDQVMINAISQTNSDCFLRTTGNRIWGMGVKGTGTIPGSFMLVDYTSSINRMTITPSGQFLFYCPLAAPNVGVVADGGGFLSQGGGQTNAWDPLNGSKAACISLMDTGGAAGSGGAVEFGASGGAWKFAAIKGGATNGASFGVGELQFWTRNVASDGFLTKKGVLANDGVWYNTNASWSALSDRSIKENIAPYTNGLDAIKGLEPVNFDYIEGTPFGSGDTRHIGLIAQDAQQFVPEFVGEYIIDAMTEDTKTIATLTPGNLVYTLINAVKELATRVEALEGAP